MEETPYSSSTTMTSAVENPVFQVTPKAAQMVKTIMKNEGREGAGLRVSVMPGGCAGYTYGLDFADAAEPEDVVVEMEGLKIFINEDIQPLIVGAKLDFVESLQGAGFVLDNPNATSSCGCGKSFM
jgi:iron-sulfur cluster assembly protein